MSRSLWVETIEKNLKDRRWKVIGCSWNLTSDQSSCPSNQHWDSLPVAEFKQKHSADMIVPVSWQNCFLFFLFYLLCVLSFLKQYLSPNGCDQECVFLDYLIYTIGKGNLDKMSLVTKNLNLKTEPARDRTSVCPLLRGCPQIRSGGGCYGIAWHDWVWFTVFCSPLVLRMNSWFHLIDVDALHWASGVTFKGTCHGVEHISVVKQGARKLLEVPGSYRKLLEAPGRSWTLLLSEPSRKDAATPTNICFYRCQLRGERWGVFQWEWKMERHLHL